MSECALWGHSNLTHTHTHLIKPHLLNLLWYHKPLCFRSAWPGFSVFDLSCHISPANVNVVSKHSPHVPLCLPRTDLVTAATTLASLPAFPSRLSIINARIDHFSSSPRSAAFHKVKSLPPSINRSAPPSAFISPSTHFFAYSSTFWGVWSIFTFISTVWGRWEEIPNRF